MVYENGRGNVGSMMLYAHKYCMQANHFFCSIFPHIFGDFSFKQPSLTIISDYSSNFIPITRYIVKPNFLVYYPHYDHTM